jgi:hypothetical protein
MPPTTYPWFETVGKSREILQGDLVDRCPVVEVPADYEHHPDVKAKVVRYDAVVLTQSCDIANAKTSIVLVCSVFPAQKLFDALGGWYSSDKGKESLKRGSEPPFHLIQACSLAGLERPLRVADFREVFGVPRKLLEDVAESQAPRIRLLPPYREHLAQALARYFMRVALPEEVDLK